MFKRPMQMFAVLLNEQMYVRLATQFWLLYEPGLTAQAKAELIPRLSQWRQEVRADFAASLCWVSAACLAGLAVGALRGSVALDLPISCPKLLASVGAALMAWPTWFALATIEDTWKKEARLDLALRTTLFKTLFFPGFVVALVGAIW